MAEPEPKADLAPAAEAEPEPEDTAEPERCRSPRSRPPRPARTTTGRSPNTGSGPWNTQGEPSKNVRATIAAARAAQARINAERAEYEAGERPINMGVDRAAAEAEAQAEREAEAEPEV